MIQFHKKFKFSCLDPKLKNWGQSLLVTSLDENYAKELGKVCWLKSCIISWLYMFVLLLRVHFIFYFIGIFLSHMGVSLFR